MGSEILVKFRDKSTQRDLSLQIAFKPNQLLGHPLIVCSLNDAAGIPVVPGELRSQPLTKLMNYTCVTLTRNIHLSLIGIQELAKKQNCKKKNDPSLNT